MALLPSPVSRAAAARRSLSTKLLRQVLSRCRTVRRIKIDARGGDKLEAATAYLARKLVFGPYR